MMVMMMVVGLEMMVVVGVVVMVAVVDADGESGCGGHVDGYHGSEIYHTLTSLQFQSSQKQKTNQHL